MRDEQKTKIELIGQLKALRQRVAQLEASEAEQKRIQERLRESKKRIENILNFCPDTIVVTDLSGKIVECNRAAPHLLGLSTTGELVGKSAFDLISPEDREKVRAEMRKILSRGYVEGTEYTLLWPDGSKFPAEVSGALIRDFLGNPTSFILVMKDLARQKKAEQIPRKSTHELGERVKELNCLYGIAQLTDRHDGLEELLEGTLELIPPAWQYPGITCARITLEDQIFKTSNFRETAWKQSSDIVVQDKKVGTVEVFYLEEKPKSHEGPFLKEERSLLDAITERLARTVELKGTERALRESREKLQNVLASSPDAITVSDLKGNIIECNQATLDLHGFSSKDEIIGKNAFDFIAPKDHKRALENMKKTIKEDFVKDVEYTFLNKDGSEFPAELSASIIRDSAGRHTSFVAITKDITERRRAEKALQDSERRYRLLAENVTDVIWTTDINLNLTYISPSVTHLMGYSLEEVMALRLEEILAPDSFLSVMKVFEEERSAGSKQGRGPRRRPTLDLEVNCKDGSTVWTETKVTYLRDAYGKTAVISGVTRDITPRKKMEKILVEYTRKLTARNRQLRVETGRARRAEEASKRAQEKLRESQQRYRALFEGAAEGILVADIETKQFKYANPAICQMLGYNEEELKRMDVRNIHPKEDLDYVISEFQAQSRGEKTLSSSIPCLRKDGTTIYADINAAKVSMDGREYNLGLFKDITRRRQAEKKMEEYAEELAAKNEQLKVETEKAKEADRLKSEFLASVSHEIRTPLSTIKGATYLLNKSSLSEEQRRFCSMIRDSGEHLLRIINDILDLARIEAGQARLEEKGLPLKELVEKTVCGFELRAKRKGLELNTIYPSDLPLEIRADEGKLSQVLTNLVDNALKFTQQGKVEVKLEKLADLNIRLQVKDTGIGISEQKLSRIFEKFYQVDGTSRRKYEGTGLGLTIVRELAKLMAGKIEARSRLGKGSTFSFTFPYSAAKQRMVQAEDQAKPKTKQQLRKEINILIAEDDDSGYYIMESLLDDYTTSRAVDGREVLEKIREKDYDLVLMDIQMPEMDGLKATRKIREKDSTLPIIALTAKAMKGDRESCLEAGCSDYLSKPIEPEELIAKVSQYLPRKARQKEK